MIPLVRLGLLEPFITYLDQSGTDTDRLLTENGLARSLVSGTGAFVPVIVIHRFLEEGARAADDPFFGVHVGERLDLAGWPPFVDAATHATTLGDFLIRFIRAARDEASSARHSLEISSSFAEFRERRTTQQEISPAQNDGFTAAYTLRLLRRGAGGDWDPPRVSATVCDPSALPRDYLGTRIHAGDRQGIRAQFPTEWLFKTVRSNALVRSSVRPAERLKVPVDFMAAFHQAIQLHAQDPGLHIDRIAKLTGTGRQTLQRHLQSHGTTFTAEVSRIRRERACDLLRTTDDPVTNVALASGFSSPTAFSRAFRSWTGESPREYRRNRRRR